MRFKTLLKANLRSGKVRKIILMKTVVFCIMNNCHKATMYFAELEKTLVKNKEIDVDRVKKAYLYAQEIHHGQKRKSGEDYITHPLAVAVIIAEFGGDENMICAALLHDVIEDGEGKEKIEKELHEKFGDEVFFLVHALSKDMQIEDKKDQQKEYFEQIHQAMENDISVFFIKIADLLHNLSTLESLPSKRQKQWIDELKNTYIPLFSEYFHHICLHYREMYGNMMEELQAIISRYDDRQELSMKH